ncbi:MAG: NERD domain-containing protein, partial [Bacteroidales bacterium]|nr:NERD domain-containing protein [Bacteroidales bacterium]
MGLFDRLKEPVFLKESSNAEVQLEKLKALEPLLNPEGQALIRQDIKCLEYGIAGEKNIAFELKNSHMPMYILHDLYLEDGDLSAQIDYLVFTKKICFVIECKNLIGDIEINGAGDFIRTTEFGGRKKKEGIYSPIT